MKKLKILSVLTAGAFMFYSCNTSEMAAPSNEVSSEALSILENAGFDIKNQAPINFEDGYLVEGDIYIPKADMHSLKEGNRLPVEEQYSTTNLVSAAGGRVITMYALEGGNSGYSPGMIAGLDEAIARYNAQNLNITFQRITTNNADITMTRLRKGEERQGILGSAGFPTAAGDPYNEIKMSGILESTYRLSTAGIATIIAHEMGHCVGFRHTDYFDRSISCGGAASNEGTAGVGANLIPGTPSGANPATDLSWMLSCTDGGDRPFTGNDQTALNYLY